MSKPRWGGAPSDKCVKCTKTVYPAEKLVMEKKIFHIECLRCVECNKKLTGANWGGFVGEDEEPYCDVHHKRLIRTIGSAVEISGSTSNWKPKTEEEKKATSNPLASRFGSGAADNCVGCGKKCYIAEKVVMEGQTWHQECLRCIECNKKLAGNNWGGFVPPDNTPHCKPCYRKLVQAAGSSVAISGSTASGEKKEVKSNPLASRFGGNAENCVKCGKRCYQAEKVVMEGKIFHIDCLRCKDCNKKLSGNNWGGFVPPDDEPMCKPCYSKLVQTAGSSVGISGSTSGWKKKEGAEKTSNPLASRFGGNAERCVTCGKRCYVAEKVVMEGKIFHVECLRCRDCNKKVGGNNWGGFVEEKAMCKGCYNKLVMAAGGSDKFSGSTGGWKKKEGAEKKSNPLASRFGGGNVDKCVGCGKKAYMAEKVMMEGSVWHQNCLRCKECNSKVSGSNYGGFVPPDNDLYCKIHYNQLVAALGDSTKISGSTTASKWNE